MKLRNKKDGEIVEIRKGEEIIIPVKDNNDEWYELTYASITELNSDWEDYEEPKEYWAINEFGTLVQVNYTRENIYDKSRKNLGNYFSSREEAEKFVEKLKAWKRLKDKGFDFHEWYKPDGCEPFIVVETNIDLDDVDNKGLQKDLDLLFGGKE